MFLSNTFYGWNLFFLILTTSFATSKSQNCEYTHLEDDFYLTDNVSKITNETEIIMNFENKIYKASNVYLLKKINTTQSWKIKFQVKLTDCNYYYGCLGDGFSFIIRNFTEKPDLLGAVAGSMGYCSLEDFSFLGVLFDYYAICRFSYPFMKFHNSTNFCYNTNRWSGAVNGSDPTGTWAGVENEFVETIISFNGSYFSVFFDSSENPWLNFPISLSSFFPSAILGWGIGTGSVKCIFHFKNISLAICDENFAENNNSNNNTTNFICENGTCYVTELILKDEEFITDITLRISGNLIVESYGKLYLIESSFSVQNSVYLEENSILVLENNSSLAIEGNFILKKNSTLNLKIDENSQFSGISVKGCINITYSNLIIELISKNRISESIIIFRNSCLSGEFSNVQLFGSECDFKKTSYLGNEVLVYFSLNCEEITISRKIITGIVLGILGVVFLVIVIHQLTKKSFSQKIDEMMDSKYSQWSKN